MGVFSDYQPIYAKHGIATFPMNGKIPAVRGFNKISRSTSAQLAARFPNSDAMAFVAGARSKITVIDIDSSDELLWRETIDRYGNSPIKVRTPSGGLHLWYLHAGEPRKIRVQSGVPVDLLGAGVVVAPPSVNAKGAYQFLEGGLEDLSRLSRVANIGVVVEGPSEVASCVGGRRLAGLKVNRGRNNQLFTYLMKAAAHLDNLDELEPLAWEFVQNHIDRHSGHHFSDAEVLATVKSVRRYTEQGENRFGGKPHTVILHETTDLLLRLGADAHYLYTFVRRMNAGQQRFLVANGLAEHMPEGAWARKRFTSARKALEGAELIILAEPPTRSGPAWYRWP